MAWGDGGSAAAAVIPPANKNVAIVSQNNRHPREFNFRSRVFIILKIEVFRLFKLATADRHLIYLFLNGEGG
jgi:hypothetical protein